LSSVNNKRMCGRNRRKEGGFVAEVGTDGSARSGALGSVGRGRLEKRPHLSGGLINARGEKSGVRRPYLMLSRSSEGERSGGGGKRRRRMKRRASLRGRHGGGGGWPGRWWQKQQGE
jgi:hypothetical protein